MADIIAVYCLNKYIRYTRRALGSSWTARPSEDLKSSDAYARPTERVLWPLLNMVYGVSSCRHTGRRGTGRRLTIRPGRCRWLPRMLKTRLRCGAGNKILLLSRWLETSLSKSIQDTTDAMHFLEMKAIDDQYYYMRSDCLWETLRIPAVYISRYRLNYVYKLRLLILINIVYLVIILFVPTERSY